MQPSSAWQPPGGTLGRILEDTRLWVPSIEGGPVGMDAGPSQDRHRLATFLMGNTDAVIGEDVAQVMDMNLPRL